MAQKFHSTSGRPQVAGEAWATGRERLKRGGKAGKNTKRMNRLEELGRVDAEKGYTKKGKRNLRDEKKRVVRELKRG
tara:strand:- start:200 stop:430 length:231 start_codon:yes stop_codon:yes gene_type:complete